MELPLLVVTNVVSWEEGVEEEGLVAAALDEKMSEDVGHSLVVVAPVVVDVLSKL